MIPDQIIFTMSTLHFERLLERKRRKRSNPWPACASAKQGKIKRYHLTMKNIMNLDHNNAPEGLRKTTLKVCLTS